MKNVVNGILVHTWDVGNLMALFASEDKGFEVGVLMARTPQKKKAANLLIGTIKQRHGGPVTYTSPECLPFVIG